MIVVYSIYIHVVIYSENLLVFASCVISGNLVTFHQGTFLENLVCSTSLIASLWSTRDLIEYYINVTKSVRDISPLMHMHQGPMLVFFIQCISPVALGLWPAKHIQIAATLCDWTWTCDFKSQEVADRSCMIARLLVQGYAINHVWPWAD